MIESQVNTTPEQASWQKLIPLVAVAGCVAQQEGDAILKRSPLVDLVVGTQQSGRLPPKVL